MLNVDMVDTITQEIYSADLSIVQDMYEQLVEVIESNGWYLHTDSYFYYVGDYSQNIQGGGVPFSQRLM